MCLELLGVVTVMLGLRETALLFKRPSARDLVAGWLGNRPRWHGRIVEAAGTAQLSFTLRGTGYVTSTPPPTATVEERLELLEKGLNTARADIAAASVRINDESRARTAALETERRAREQGDEESRKLTERVKAGGLYLEVIGVIWLALGIILATASGEIVRLLHLA
jgi:hypothetical protein